MAFNWYTKEGQNLRTTLLLHHFELLHRAKVNFIYAHYLKTPDNKEISEYLHRHYSFNVFRIACFRIAWIAISNLFANKKNERFNLPLLIKDLKTTKYGIDVVPTILLENWERKIEIHFDPIAEEFIKIRDKHFVHLDEDRPDKTNITLDYSNLESLIDIAEEILIYLKNEIISGGEIIFYEELDDLKRILALLTKSDIR